jgi:sortase A
MTQNIRRNKDAADLPPPYFYGSGDIPTDTSSPYHDNLPGGVSVSSGGSFTDSYYGGNGTGGSMGSVGNSANLSVSSAVSVNQPDGLLAPTSTFSGAASGYSTEPKYNSDGTIGTLYIESLDKTLKVYEGESLENMKSGIGHFSETSAWDGNCVFAGHNRGAAAYFSFVKDLDIGDEITYTTPYGTRTYEVYNKAKISETDYSGLAWSTENIIGLITCVENERALRWLVQAREI